MTCRHREGDTSCTSGKSPEGLYEKGQRIIKEGNELMEKWGPKIGKALPPKPDNSKFQVLDTFSAEPLLVLKVEYPSCKECSYEGTKIMVFEGVSLNDAIKWTKIDPHFREDLKEFFDQLQAPSPIARFPASEQGWVSAQKFAQDLQRIAVKVGYNK